MLQLLCDEQAQKLALQGGDTRRHPMMHATGNSTAGYSIALNLNIYNRCKYKTL